MSPIRQHSYCAPTVWARTLVVYCRWQYAQQHGAPWYYACDNFCRGADSSGHIPVQQRPVDAHDAHLCWANTVLQHSVALINAYYCAVYSLITAQ
jgi:hypothetical protein